MCPHRLVGIPNVEGNYVSLIFKSSLVQLKYAICQLSFI